MKVQMIIALVLLVAGAGLAYWGYDMSQNVGNQLVKALGNSTSDKVIAAYTGAAACIVVGFFLLVRGK